MVAPLFCKKIIEQFHHAVVSGKAAHLLNVRCVVLFAVTQQVAPPSFGGDTAIECSLPDDNIMPQSASAVKLLH